MPNASNTTINELDESFNVLEPVKGLYMAAGICTMGPVNDPSVIIRSWPQFKRLFGGYSSTSDFPLLCQLMLEGGCSLRVNNIRHYSDVTDRSTLSATKATITAFANATPTNLFSLAVKYPGAAYNGMTAIVEAATNGNSAYFNLRITLASQGLSELYENLTIPGNPTAANSTYLADVVSGSELVDVTYSDISGTSGQQRPVNVTKTFASGSNGGSVVATDYSGDSAARTGLHAFNAFDDASDLCVPEVSDTDVATAIAAYAEGRKDILGFIHLANTNDLASELITDRNSTAVDSSYAYIVAGGHKIKDPVTGLNKNISEMAAVFTLLARADANDGPPQPFTGRVKGKITNSLGVVNNFGGPGSFTDLNSLANAQINMLVQEKGVTYLKGNFTGQLANSKTSWANIRRYLIYLKKQLEPLVNPYLESEPNHFITWKKIYNDVEPVLRRHRDEHLAISGYTWLGDQDITKMANMVINNQTDVDNGKYKVKLRIAPVGTINEIEIDLVIVAGSVTFENETIINP